MAAHTRFGSFEDILVHAAVALVFAMAVVARVYGLADNPDGLLGAEAKLRGAASDVVDGRFIGLWSEAAGGQPAGFVYWLAGWSQLFGDSTAVLRLLSAWVGLATVGVFYLFCRSSFGERAAVLGSLLLALGLWHLSYSRLALPLGHLVLLEVVTVHFLLMALRETRSVSKQRRLLLLAGVSFGAAAYTHNAFLIFALVVVLWWAREFLAGEHPMGEVLKRSLVFFVPALIVALPYLGSLAYHAGEATDRVRAIDLSSAPEYRAQPGVTEKIRYALGNIARTGRAMLWRPGPGQADEGLGRRLLDPATALLAAAGLIAILWRWKAREHFYLLALVGASLVIVGLTRDSGMYGRLIVALPAVFASAGYAFDGLLVLMKGRVSQVAAYVVVALVIAFVAFYNLRSYYDAPVGRSDDRWAYLAPHHDTSGPSVAFRTSRDVWHDGRRGSRGG